MANQYFQFKQFTIQQDRCAMKVTTDACLFGAWVAREIKAKNHGVRNMLDIGVGTGLLTLMIAQKNRDIIIDGIEIDKEACKQAKENVTDTSFSNKISLWQGDILKESLDRKYDVIISNPPFYENELKSPDDQKNVAHHGESLSLEGLLPIIKDRLSTAGSSFYLLLPYKRKKEIELLFKKNKLFFTKIVSVRQSVNHDYFRLMVAGSLYNDFEAEETEMAVRDEQDQYTQEFIQLLKDYYLHL